MIRGGKIVPNRGSSPCKRWQETRGDTGGIVLELGPLREFGVGDLTP